MGDADADLGFQALEEPEHIVGAAHDPGLPADAGEHDGEGVRVLAFRPDVEPKPLVDPDSLQDFLRGPVEVDQQVHGLLKALVEGHQQSDTALASDTGVDRRRIPDLCCRLASVCAFRSSGTAQQLCWG